jgi:hypothetical protein
MVVVLIEDILVKMLLVWKRFMAGMLRIRMEDLVPIQDISQQKSVDAKTQERLELVSFLQKELDHERNLKDLYLERLLSSGKISDSNLDSNIDFDTFKSIRKNRPWSEIRVQFEKRKRMQYLDKKSSNDR